MISLGEKISDLEDIKLVMEVLHEVRLSKYHLCRVQRT